MTKETRHFIELADILSFQFRCKKCQATVSRPISEFHSGPGAVCQNCNADWAYIDDAKTTDAITQLVEKIRYVNRIKERKNFTLQIEVAYPPEEPTIKP